MSIYDFYIPYSSHYPAQFLALMHIQDNFLDSGVKKLELLKKGIRLTDKTGATADFIYNPKTRHVDMVERNEKFLKKEKKYQTTR